MKKNARKNLSTEGAAIIQTLIPIASVIRNELYEFVVSKGLQALEAILEAEREAICGPEREQENQPYRAGSTRGKLVMGGRQISARKPRVRHQGHEVRLPSWEQFSSKDPLQERALEQMILGVATRGYSRSLEKVPQAAEPSGVSRSSVSRRFIAATKKQLDSWLSRDISGLGLACIMLDGIIIDEHVVVVALGISEEGNKHVLGLWEGATENTEVCISLLSNLVERGLETATSYLFVIDGSKALRKAIRDVFGKRVLVQCCQVHKRRNGLNDLPKSMHKRIGKAISEAYHVRPFSQAKRRLNRLATRLENNYPSAASSLREGLQETLTVKRRKLAPILERSLSSTNQIENLNGSIRRINHRVKRWRGGTMILRWTAAALIEAEQGFKRLQGNKWMPKLVRALKEHSISIDQKKKAA